MRPIQRVKKLKRRKQPQDHDHEHQPGKCQVELQAGEVQRSGIWHGKWCDKQKAHSHLPPTSPSLSLYLSAFLPLPTMSSCVWFLFSAYNQQKHLLRMNTVPGAWTVSTCICLLQSVLFSGSGKAASCKIEKEDREILARGWSGSGTIRRVDNDTQLQNTKILSWDYHILQRQTC